MDDREYLISQAVNQYNKQFGKNLPYSYFDIKSIPTRVNYERSYEVSSTRFDDFLRLHIHLVFGNTDSLESYRLETDQSFVVDGLGDEVFVAGGSINRYYVDSGYYKFRIQLPDESVLPIILAEDSVGITDEAGEFILEETAT